MWRLDRFGPVAVITFDRPPENLLNFVLLNELDDLLLGLSGDKGVHVVVVTGGVPGYFVGHADLDDVVRLVEGNDDDDDLPGSPAAWTTTLRRMAEITQPVVAAVNGQAWGGGCELALAAQLRVAGESAHFSFVEVGAGAIPGAGGTQRLPRLVGHSRATRIILSGEVVSAGAALNMGLVDAVVPDDGFLDNVLTWLDPIARQPRHSLAAAKRAIVDGLRLPLEDGLAYEQALFRGVLRSPETRAIFAHLDRG